MGRAGSEFGVRSSAFGAIGSEFGGRDSEFWRVPASTRVALSGEATGLAGDGGSPLGVDSVRRNGLRQAACGSEFGVWPRMDANSHEWVSVDFPRSTSAAGLAGDGVSPEESEAVRLNGLRPPNGPDGAGVPGSGLGISGGVADGGGSGAAGELRRWAWCSRRRLWERRCRRT